MTTTKYVVQVRENADPDKWKDAWWILDSQGVYDEEIKAHAARQYADMNKEELGFFESRVIRRTLTEEVIASEPQYLMAGSPKPEAG